MRGKDNGCLCQNMAVAAGELRVTSPKHGRHLQISPKMQVTSLNPGRYPHGHPRYRTSLSSPVTESMTNPRTTTSEGTSG